ncbi:DUF1990 family protein [Frankia sp. CcI49]|uniref:DUF1990 family protein n=1 Tax=Frankia sp. R43 TaxID=269536 RepID=UPI000978260B
MRLQRSSPSSLERDVHRCRNLELTYPERGATAGPLPDGYHHVMHRIQIGTGRTVFDRASGALLDWSMQRGAGLRLAATRPLVETGATVLMCAGPGPVGIAAPCRVVWVLDEPDRRGFAYGTLPGHPESGEEAFVVEWDAGAVWLTIAAFSRPDGLLSRLGAPVGRRVQDVVTRRYIRAVRRLVADADPKG